MQGTQDRRVGALLRRRLHPREDWLGILLGSLQGKQNISLDLMPSAARRNRFLAMSQERNLSPLVCKQASRCAARGNFNDLTREQLLTHVT